MNMEVMPVVMVAMAMLVVMAVMTMPVMAMTMVPVAVAVAVTAGKSLTRDGQGSSGQRQSGESGGNDLFDTSHGLLLDVQREDRSAMLQILERSNATRCACDHTSRATACQRDCGTRGDCEIFELLNQFEHEPVPAFPDHAMEQTPQRRKSHHRAAAKIITVPPAITTASRIAV
jgi:hypothetical protein